MAYHIGKIESTKDEKLPVEANSICDGTLARWPSEHNTHKCTGKRRKTINIRLLRKRE